MVVLNSLTEILNWLKVYFYITQMQNFRKLNYLVLSYVSTESIQRVKVIGKFCFIQVYASNKFMNLLEHNVTSFYNY